MAGVHADRIGTAPEALRVLAWVTDELMRLGIQDVVAHRQAGIDDFQDVLHGIDRLKTNAMAKVAVDAKLVTPTGTPTTSAERREAFRRGQRGTP